MNYHDVMRDMMDHGGSSSMLSDNMLNEIENPEWLHLLSTTYNWDDGLRVPNLIVENKCCELSTALTVFYLAGGYDYLENRDECYDDRKWYSFVKKVI